MIVSNERLNHYLGCLIEMVFGNGSNDLMAFATPTKRKLGQHKNESQYKGRKSLHGRCRTKSKKVVQRHIS
jgi:hypothetical protein